MTANELLEIIKCGEDSRHQFKRVVKSEAELAEDFVAFSNGDGGQIFVGVADDGTVIGLTSREVADLNKRISNAASQWTRPEPQVTTENLASSDGSIVVVITVPPGIAKPYQDKDGNFWVKKGADNRKAVAREELQRMFQRSGLIHADETPVNDTAPDSIEPLYFSSFCQTHYDDAEVAGVPFPQLLKNLNLLADSGELNVAGMLLFGKQSLLRLPVFVVKAVAFPGDSMTVCTYLDSRDFGGRLAEQFQATVAFLVNNTRTYQNGRSVNSLGEPEIPRTVWDELVANALVHRDYFISAPIRVLVFSDRVEIISPGHLPNHLTVENIKAGNSNIRNPIIASFAAKILPYKGLGTGILRALKAYPHIDFIDDRDGNLFKVVVKRLPRS